MTERPAYARRMMVVTREPQRPAQLGRVAGVLAVASLALFFATRQPLWVFGMFGASVAFLASRWLAAQPTEEETHVEVSSEGVRVGGELVPVSSIAQAFWVPRFGAPSTVRLQSAVGATIFEAHVEGEDDAAAFLAALGRDVSHQRITFSVDTPYGVGTRHPLLSAVLSILVLVAAVKVSGLLLTLLFAAAAANFAVMAVAPHARVEVGADGMHVAWLGYHRFYSYRDVRALEPIPLGARIVLTSGKTHDIRFEVSADTEVEALVRRDALIARANEAIAERARATSRQELLELLSRRGRPAVLWAREVEALRAGGEGYRSAAVRDEDLWDVVRDPTAPPDARAAAALVLRRTTGDRSKLRVAADTVVEPRLRVALEAAAEDDDAALDAAIEAVGRE